MSYSDFGSRISISVCVSPFQEPFNFTQTFLRMHIASGANDSVTKVMKLDHTQGEMHVSNFDFYANVSARTSQLNLSLKMTTNAESPFAFNVGIDPDPIDTDYGVVAAIFILIFLNILINAEVNRLIECCFFDKLQIKI